VREANVEREAQRCGAGIVGEDERAIAGAEQMAGAQCGGEAGLLGRAPRFAFVAADGSPKEAVLRSQHHVDRAGFGFRDGRLAALAFRVRHRAEAYTRLATIARFHHAAALRAAQMQRHEQLAGGELDAVRARGVVRLVDLHRLRPGLRRVAAAAEVDVDLRIEGGEEQEGLFLSDEQRRIKSALPAKSCNTVASLQVRP